MQTSQEVLARREFERVTTLVPGEPAGWANLGLLLMRQQELEARGAEAREGGRAGAEERGHPAAAGPAREPPGPPSGGDPALEDARRSLDPSDLRAPYALAARPRAAGRRRRRRARPSACSSRCSRGRRIWPRASSWRASRPSAGDAAALQKAIAPLAEASRSWPAPAQEQLARAAGGRRPTRRAAATRVAFLKNVLLRAPEFRRALAAVSTPAQRGRRAARRGSSPCGIPSRSPRRADEALTFERRRRWRAAGRADGVRVAGVARPDEGPPVVVAAGADERAAPGRRQGRRFPAAARPAGTVRHRRRRLQLRLPHRPAARRRRRA